MTSSQWIDFQDNIKSAFGNLIEDNDSDFADLTLACEDGHQPEAHKVILDGSRPQTTIRTHWSSLEILSFIQNISPKVENEGEGKTPQT